MTIAEALSEGRGALTDAGVPDPSREAISLLAHALRAERTFVIAHPEYELAENDRDTYLKFIARRAAREPLQYIVGVQEFFGLPFEVTPDVLIPRPETEILVERAIDILAPSEHPRFCEIGTGSGCITVAMLHALPHATAMAVDISEKALAVARRNASNNGADDRVQFLTSDVFANVPAERFDAVVSNPPYVPDADIQSLQIEVRAHEPRTALAGGLDGLSVVKRIIDEAPPFLSPNGYLFVEIGFNQSTAVESFIDPGVWTDVEFLPDLQGIPRILVARLA